MVSMGNVWDRTTEFLSDTMSAVVPIALLAIFLPMSLQSAIQPLLPTLGPVGIIGLRIVTIGLSIVTLWGQLAIIALAVDPLAGRLVATRRATARLLPAIGIYALLLLIVVALFVPVPIALAMGGMNFQAAMAGVAPTITPAIGWFVLLYGIAATALFIWLMARLVLTNPVVVTEQRGFGALARSFSLTRGIALKIIGVLILFAIIAFVGTLAARTVFGSILRLIAGGEGTITVAGVLTGIVLAAITTGFAVLAASFTAKLYLAVRDAHEAIVERL